MKIKAMRIRSLLAVGLVLGLLVLVVFLAYNPRKSRYLMSFVDELKDTYKHRSSSLKTVVQEFGGINDYNNMVVIYNRVPKTGSTSFMKIGYQLTSMNHFSSLYLRVSRKWPMNLADEAWVVRNISQWQAVRPAIFHGHFAYINFEKHGSTIKPIFINVIRDPLDRLVSFYYFMRYGDTFLPNKKRSRMGDETTFDDCVKKKGKDCQAELLWLQIPYFCGNVAKCWTPGSKWALEQAKKHLADSYYLVGVTEEMEKFIRVLDHTLPRIFQGATEAYLKDGGLHIRKTKQKKPLARETIDYFKSTKIWKLENEFYQFARGIFMKQYNSLFKEKEGEVLRKQSDIVYEKVKLVLH